MIKPAVKKSHMTTPRIAPALLRVMGDQEWTVKELADKIGYSEAGISEVLRKMDAHISSWYKNQQTLAPRWRLGKGEHARRPITEASRRTMESRKKRSNADYLVSSYVKSERIVWNGMVI
jgi:hypothetical protein